MKKVLFIKNTVILTATAFLLRSVGIFFRVWLTGKIGSEGIGLYQVIFSVYVLAATFATCGICTAVTQIATRCLNKGDIKGCNKTVRIAIFLSLLLSLITSLIIVMFAKPISVYLVGDIRATAAIKILCIGLPFMGTASCIRGYFTARRSSVPQSVGQIFEQAIRITLTVWLIGSFGAGSITSAAAAVMLGDCLAEAAGAVIIYIWYKIDRKRVRQKSTAVLKGRSSFFEIFRISTPIALGRYLHTALRTAENIITPICFSKYTDSRSSALSQFGMVKGMALPILLFPASLLSSISTLLVPEITEAVANKNKYSVKSAVEKVFYITFTSAFLIAALFFVLANQVGVAVYKSSEVGWLIKALAPLVPFMYIDLIADGILKGLDCQKFIFKNSVGDSACRILLIILAVPKLGMAGFLAVMLFSNAFTATSSVVKILKTTGVSFNFKAFFIKPLFSSACAVVASGFLCEGLKHNLIIYMICVFLLTTLFYFILMTLIGGINTKAIFYGIKNKLKK